MKKFVCLIGLIFLFNSSSAFANNDKYFKVSGMVSILPDSDLKYNGVSDGKTEFDTGFGLSVAIGKKYESFFLEAEYAYRKADYDPEGDDLDDLAYRASKALMFNAGYEFGQEIKPYVLVGMGMHWVNRADEGEFAYQVGAGLSAPITSNIDIFTGYKYFASSDLESERNNSVKASFDSHNFEAGIKYSF